MSDKYKFDLNAGAPNLGGQQNLLNNLLSNLLGGGGAQPMPQEPQVYQGRPAGKDAELPPIPQDNISDFIEAYFRAKDPVGYANKMRDLPAEAPGSLNPFATGFFQGGAKNLSPEAVLASQGATAGNQWAQLGGAPGINPNELRRLNSSRPKVY